MQSKTLKTIGNIDLKISGLKLIKKIGEGGMSMVYLAEQLSLKRKVAVKVMRLEIADNELDVQRFKHEAKTIAQLDHPSIINIYNIGQTTTGEVFFTMPYLNHGDLSTYILENEQEFISLLKSVCEGLKFAHDHGVVHRDIKPENLLFDKFGNIRIADFGIAISKDGTRMTQEHQIVGSAQYMSPEQAQSQTVGVCTDIYSLGIVIYERLTGEVPFDSDDSISILVNHVSSPIPRLATKMRHWQNLIDKCLAKKAEDRFQSMEELKNAIDKIPTNSLQRTNSSIKQAIANKKEYSKWVIPVIFSLVLFIIIFYSYINNEDNNTEIDDINSLELTVEPSETIIKKVPEAKINPVADFNIEKTDSNLSLDEIIVDTETNQYIPDNQETTSEDPNETFKKINTLSEQIFNNIEENKLTLPRDDNALDKILLILSVDPNNLEAIKSLNKIGIKYYQLIINALDKKNYISALSYSYSVINFYKKSNYINPEFDEQKSSVISVVEKLDLSNASVSSQQVQALADIVRLFSPEHHLKIGLIKLAAKKAMPQIGDKLLDSLNIETILVTPQLAVTTQEITVEQYAKFALDTKIKAKKCRHRGAGSLAGFFSSKTWNNPYFPQESNHPVTCVSYNDAIAYSNWLSIQTKNKYRLLTKQEWVMLASSKNNHFKPCKSANVTGTEAKNINNKEAIYSCDDNFKFTAPVSSFLENKIGLYDLQGNVSEWVGCEKTPCKAPIAMGSSWFNGKKSNILELAKKLKISTGYSYVGIRLARDITINK